MLIGKVMGSVVATQKDEKLLDRKFLVVQMHDHENRPKEQYVVAAILEDRPIDIYNHGEMRRDFTYIDDLIEGITRLIDVPPIRPASPAEIAPGDSLSPVAPYRVVNIGNGAPVRLLDFVEAIEEALGRKARRNMMEMQQGDVPATWADSTLLQSLTGFAPDTDLRDGVARFVAWYRDYYEV